MKKTLSMLYRLAFMIFGVWAFYDYTGFAVLAMRSGLSDFFVWVDILCFFMIACVFFISMHREPTGVVLHIKSVLTFLALFVCALHFDILLQPTRGSWCLTVLLPLMMLADYLLFDRKIRYGLTDVLFWIAALAFLLALWGIFVKRAESFSAFMDMLGGKDTALRGLLSCGLGGAVMYLLDKFFSGSGKPDLANLISFVYRLLYLALTGWALAGLCDRTLLQFVLSLSQFGVASAFLCFLCIAVVVILCLFRGRSLSAATPFPRLKGLFTLLAALVVLSGLFLMKRDIYALSVQDTVLYYISPVMMVFDWILFDAKGKMKPLDPLLWSMFPLLYGVGILASGRLYVVAPHITVTPKLIGMVAICVFLTAYVVFVLDICLKKRR